MFECDHRLIDARLRRLAEAVVRKVEVNPAWKEQMTRNVDRWSNPRQEERWRELLGRPWPEFRKLLLEDSEAGAALRQDAPLGGILTSRERGEILRQFAHDPHPA